MPPLPSGATILYGPKVVPGDRITGASAQLTIAVAECGVPRGDYMCRHRSNSDRGRVHGDRVEGTFTSSRAAGRVRSEEHTSELQSRVDLVCRLLLEKKKMY